MDRRLRLLALSGLVSLFAFSLTPASGKSAVLSSGDDLELAQWHTFALEVPMDVTAAATKICTSTLRATGGYFKPKGVFKFIREFGDGTVTNDCSASEVPSIKVTLNLTHHCFPGSHATSDSDSGSAPGPVVVSVYQEVAQINIPQWCSYGSAIRWRYKVIATSNIGDQEVFCLNISATYGLNPVAAPETVC